jgi:hypothetical protein
VWHETPAIGRDRSSTPAFDMSRSMKLNRRNEVVAEIVRFVGVNLEAIREDLERQDRERRQSEEQKRLQRQGSKIADLINEHFKGWRAKLRNTMAKAGIGKDLLLAKERNDAAEIGVIFGDELPGVFVGPSVHEGDWPGPGPTPRPPKVKLDENSDNKIVKNAPGVTKKTASGGFNVAFEKIGANEKRAKYDKQTRTIIVNLDIAVELKNSPGQSPVDDPNFVRMAYEIGFKN